MIDESEYPGPKVRILSAPSGVVKPQRDGNPSAKPFGGVVFIGGYDDRSETEAPAKLKIPMDYAREHHWIELVDQSPVVYPGGTPDDPWRVTHTVFEASKVVLHMRDGDVEYRVVRQPGKYDADGNPVEKGAAGTGDPTHEVHWSYLLEKI